MQNLKRHWRDTVKNTWGDCDWEQVTLETHVKHKKWTQTQKIVNTKEVKHCTDSEDTRETDSQRKLKTRSSRRTNTKAHRSWQILVSTASKGWELSPAATGMWWSTPWTGGHFIRVTIPQGEVMQWCAMLSSNFFLFSSSGAQGCEKPLPEWWDHPQLGCIVGAWRP